jgi:hypothetical protein
MHTHSFLLITNKNDETALPWCGSLKMNGGADGWAASPTEAATLAQNSK